MKKLSCVGLFLLLGALSSISSAFGLFIKAETRVMAKPVQATVDLAPRPGVWPIKPPLHREPTNALPSLPQDSSPMFQAATPTLPSATIPGTSPTNKQVQILGLHLFKGSSIRGPKSTTLEPTTAMAGKLGFLTANWFAAFSEDSGSAWQEIVPFPASAHGQFCCDQVVIYDKAHDLFFWLLQYEPDQDQNVLRLAVTRGTDLGLRTWSLYDFTSQEVLQLKGEFFDYSHLTVGDKFLYITTNTKDGAGFKRAVVLRVPLERLATASDFTYHVFFVLDDIELRATQGATSTMFWAGHHGSTNSLRVYSWEEGADQVDVIDVPVDPWDDRYKKSKKDRGVLGPDKNPWLDLIDPAITAGWATSGKLGFAWTAAADTEHKFPHVRAVVLDAATKAVIAQPQLWSLSFAYAYPAAAPNSKGVVGIAVFFGGGTAHPSPAVGFLDSNPSGMAWSFKLLMVRKGRHGPRSGEWGDYISILPDTQDAGGSWVATGFTLITGDRDKDVEPLVVRFKKR
jgi:hypothetical protein